ncbi:receptor-interacting serine/threonine-protein kinase 3-like [Clavelina lepadiformis]|uniref:receptor-interacting serine/threonine-protein kinase 3-like n=1 Tax=Clavelina lepadiformis TaxID=159417 RepID=UPI0040410562
MLPSSLPSYEASSLQTSENEDDLIGHGSFAYVRKCENPELGVVVAKCFSIEGSSGKHKNAFEKVAREVTILAHLKHKNIIRIFGTTKWSKCIGIIMEYANNSNLEDILLEYIDLDIPWALRLRFTDDVANGLKYLHHGDSKRAFVHGDLKPQNILLDSDLVAKLADFGSMNIRKATGALSGSISVTSSTQHTPLYSAPELLKDPTDQRQPSMDVYSLGMVIYEIVTRHGAYGGCPGIIQNLIKECGQKPDLKHVQKVKSELQDKPQDFMMFQLLETLMEQCWNFEANSRPDINEVHHKTNTKCQEVLKEVTDSFENIKNELNKKLKNNVSGRKTALCNFAPPFDKAFKNDQASHSDAFESIQSCTEVPKEVRQQTSSQAKADQSEDVSGLKRHILETLERSYPQAVPLTIISKTSPCKKKEVNHLLYAMKQEGFVEKTKAQPPEWKLVKDQTLSHQYKENTHGAASSVAEEIKDLSAGVQSLAFSNPPPNNNQKIGNGGSLEETLLSILESKYPNAVPLLDIVKQSDQERKTVNKALYGMENRDLVRKTQKSPPHWCLIK